MSVGPPAVVYPPQSMPSLAPECPAVDDNSRTAYILVAMFAIVFVAFVAAIYGLAFYEGW